MYAVQKGGVLFSLSVDSFLVHQDGKKKSMASSSRKNPNILITGTPGTGKTTTSDMVSQEASMKHINVSSLVKEKKLYSSVDEAYDTVIFDEDKLLDELEIQVEGGGSIVDFHTADIFPERWFDLVIVLTCDNSILYDRLEKRGYNQLKLQENLEAEIMQVLVEEARESYDSNIVHILSSNSIEDMESNVQRISQWIENFRLQHS